MMSVSGNKWSERKLNNRIIEKISIDNNLSYDLSKLILDRNYSLDEIKEVLSSMSLSMGMDLPGWPPENIEELSKKYEDPFKV